MYVTGTNEACIVLSFESCVQCTNTSLLGSNEYPPVFMGVFGCCMSFTSKLLPKIRRSISSCVGCGIVYAQSFRQELASPSFGHVWPLHPISTTSLVSVHLPVRETA